jgi:hypothetical protein
VLVQLPDRWNKEAVWHVVALLCAASTGGTSCNLSIPIVARVTQAPAWRKVNIMGGVFPLAAT